MKRVALTILLAALLTATGCGGKSTGKPSSPEAPAPAPAPAAEAPSAPQPVTPPPPAPNPKQPREQAAIDRRSVTLDQMRTQLEAYMNGPGEASPRERLGALLAGWGVAGRDDGNIATIPLAEADLNGDGSPELVAAINTWGDYTTMPSGAVFVISRQGDTYKVDRSEAPPQAYVDGVGLMGVKDLTRDGKLDIIWLAGDHGAHTASTRVLVSSWQPGKVTNLAGDMWTTMAKVRVEGQDILLTGGTVGSAGAGMAQRAATLRYRWGNGTFALADRRFEPSDYGYHLLIDGINSELFARFTDAEPLYRLALEPGRPALPPDYVPPEWRERFSQAVTEFARFRLGSLLMGYYDSPDEARKVLAGASGPFAGLSQAMAGAENQAVGCNKAFEWGRANPEFLAALNAPYGYNNLKWDAGHLCGYAFPEVK